ncbi:hypothetical protein CU044_6098 [Streptomyces sp. L-9-10]|uniref:hypothetical protein n=1 Tax=unclassified Streptomyces TaxID=2593676 RepID=UPI0010ED2937|nr:hypothetical protein [Streptomyces sp. L-9-10]RYJ21948.1 hypothetical protein CU044_6098 [Streptomyces sp. L-9-10]
MPSANDDNGAALSVYAAYVTHVIYGFEPVGRMKPYPVMSDPGRLPHVTTVRPLGAA